MKKPASGFFAAFGILAIAAVIGVVIGANWLGAANTGAALESQIKATQDNNRQVLGQYTIRIAEMGQVPAMQRDDLSKVMTDAFEGRYGEDGSQAVFQWIKEAYPGQVDNQLYRNLQTEMSAGRIEFASNQTKLLDQKRVYETKLNQPISGLFLKMAGYPKIDLDSIRIVSSQAAEKAFETGLDEPVKLR